KSPPAIEVTIREVPRKATPPDAVASVPSIRKTTSKRAGSKRSPPARVQPAPEATRAPVVIAGSGAPAGSDAGATEQGSGRLMPWTEPWMRAEGLLARDDKPPPGLALHAEQMGKALGIAPA